MAKICNIFNMSANKQFYLTIILHTAVEITHYYHCARTKTPKTHITTVPANPAFRINKINKKFAH